VLVANFSQLAHLGFHPMQTLTQVCIWSLFALVPVSAHGRASP
jgi:hypothetical protein